MLETPVGGASVALNSTVPNMAAGVVDGVGVGVGVVVVIGVGMEVGVGVGVCFIVGVGSDVNLGVGFNVGVVPGSTHPKIDIINMLSTKIKTTLFIILYQSL